MSRLILARQMKACCRCLSTACHMLLRGEHRMFVPAHDMWHEACPGFLHAFEAFKHARLLLAIEALTAKAKANTPHVAQQDASRHREGVQAYAP